MGNSMVLTPTQINGMRYDADQAQRDYLRSNGWEYRCDTPGSFWLWHKRLADGRTMAVSATCAMFMQSFLTPEDGDDA